LSQGFGRLEFYDGGVVGDDGYWQNTKGLPSAMRSHRERRLDRGEIAELSNAESLR